MVHNVDIVHILQILSTHNTRPGVLQGYYPGHARLYLYMVTMSVCHTWAYLEESIKMKMF